MSLSNTEVQSLRSLIEALLSQVGDLGARLAAAEAEVGQGADEGDGVMVDTIGDPMPVGAPPVATPCLFDLAYLTKTGDPTSEGKLYIYYPDGVDAVKFVDAVCAYDTDHLDVFDPDSSESFPDDEDWKRLNVVSGKVFLNVEAAEDTFVWWLGSDPTTADNAFSVQIGEAIEDERRIKQTYHGVYCFYRGALPGDNPAGEAVEIVLDGYGATADQRTWEYGDTDEDTGLPLKPTVKSPRLFWDDPNHQLLCFMRAMSYNSDGMLVAVSAESAVDDSIVFTTVSEMP